jgi:hypothetical protein
MLLSGSSRIGGVQPGPLPRIRLKSANAPAFGSSLNEWVHTPPWRSQSPRLFHLVALFEARCLIDDGIDNSGSGSFDTRPLLAR